VSKWLRRLLIVAGVAAGLILLRVTVLRPNPVPVQVVEIAPGRVEETVTNSRAGTVKARRRAMLSPEIGGQVTEIPFREGDSVAKGDVLLRIEDSLQRSRLELAARELEALEADRQRACLEAERAAREVERNRRLAREEIVSADLLDEIESLQRGAEAACRAAEANVARAEAAVRLARTELEKMLIRAPFDGIVAEVEIEVGEWTTPSPPALPVPPVVDLLDPSSVYISAPMDEVDSARIHEGQPARITVDSYRDQHFDGGVMRIAPYVLDLEAQNRTVEIEVAIEAPPQNLLPGTSADVEIILDTRESVLRIPTSALMGGDRVLVFAEGSLEERQLELGLRNWDYTEVIAGLDAGELVVTSLDRAEVKAGARAEVVETEEE
jgi:HlyD family secretion protein